MYYRLKAPWAFCGWKKTPCAIRAEYGPDSRKKPIFYDKPVFLELLCLNGEENVSLSDFSEEGRAVVHKLMERGALEQAETPLPPLEEWQRYRLFPSRFIANVHWSITGKCNFRCRHCLVSAPKAVHPQLPLEDCLHIIDEIDLCGIRRVDITGGEPLVRHDFREIVKRLSEKRIAIGVLFTNASLLSEEILDMLEEYHQKPAFQLSFDGLRHHDWLRGVAGAEQQADTALRLLQRRGMYVSVAMCIHKENKDSLRDTIRYLADLGVQELRVNSPESLGEWKEYEDRYALSRDEVWEVFRTAIYDYFQDGMPISLELDGFFRCSKGSTDYKMAYYKENTPDVEWSRIPYCETVRTSLYIGPEGKVEPCMGFSATSLFERLPSVLDEHLADITLRGAYHDAAFTSVGDYLEKNPDCVSCPHLSHCLGGCMLQDTTEDGDFLVPDSRCCYFHKHVGRAAVDETVREALHFAGLKNEKQESLT